MQSNRRKKHINRALCRVYPVSKTFPFMADFLSDQTSTKRKRCCPVRVGGSVRWTVSLYTVSRFAGSWAPAVLVSCSELAWTRTSPCLVTVAALSTWSSSPPLVLFFVFVLCGGKDLRPALSCRSALSVSGVCFGYGWTEFRVDPTNIDQ